jgi:hypothetical protein
MAQEEIREGKKLILDHQNYICHEIIQKDYKEMPKSVKMEGSTA